MSEVAKQDTTPANWVRHTDAWTGFEISHPPGWRVLCNGGPILVREDPNGAVEASIWPIHLPASPHRADLTTVVQKYFVMAQALDPSFKVWLFPEQTPSPGHLVIRIRSRRGSQAVEGRANILAVGSNALIRSFHVPVDTPEDSIAPLPRTLEMTRILDSFHVISATPWLLYQEPAQSAFSAAVPTGWISSGKLAHDVWSGAVTLQFSTEPDSRGLTKFCVPGSHWLYTDSNWFGTKFMSAADFARSELLKKLQLNGLRIEECEEWPALLPHFYTEAARAGLRQDDVEVSTTRATATSNIFGTAVRHHMFITASRPRGAATQTSPLAGHWVANLLSYYHAPQAEFAVVQPVLAGIANSYRINPIFLQREAAQNQIVGQMLAQQLMMQQRQIQQNFMHVQQHIHQNQSQISEMIMGSWEYRNHMQDNAMHQFSNATLGLTDVVNPATHTVYSVQNDFERYWRTDDGYIVGGSWGTQPDPSWQQLDPFKC